MKNADQMRNLECLYDLFGITFASQDVSQYEKFERNDVESI